MVCDDSLERGRKGKESVDTAQEMKAAISDVNKATKILHLYQKNGN